FDLCTIDIHGYGLLDEVHADDQTVPLFSRNEDALSASEQAALNPYPHAFNEVRMWTTGEAMLHHGADHGNLLLGYRHRFAIDAHNTHHTKSFQHWKFILQSKIAKEIATEQWNINELDAVLPDTALLPQR